MTRRSLLATAAIAPLRAQGPTVAKPILLGNWADPTILKVGPDYYMTHSSFEWHPGLLVWHSRDLRHWRALGHAVTNQPGSLWAPELIRYQNEYRIYYPAAQQNWLVTAPQPSGPWTPPLSVGVGRIDPGFVTTPAGEPYLHLSGGAAVALNAQGTQAQGAPKVVYEGWPIPSDWAVECFCLESPKFTFRDGWYHLVSAQGGTQGPSTSHMVVSARSRSPLGPWENSPYNPVIRTYARQEEWWSKGHGTLVEGPDGHWYCVLHGIKNGYRTLGRPTLIEPIEWAPDGWWKRAPRWPAAWEQPATYDWGDVNSFAGPRPPLGWQMHGLLESERWRCRAGRMELEGRGTNPGNSRPVGPMAMHLSYEVEVDVSLEGSGAAGLLLFSGPDDYIGTSLDTQGKLTRAQKGPYKRYPRTDEPAWPTPTVSLKIVNQHQDVRFYARQAGEAWRLLGPSMDVSNGGVLRPVLFSRGALKATFQNFRYQPLP